MFQKCLPKKAFMREMMKISKIVTISRKYHKYKGKYTFLPLPIKTYIYICIPSYLYQRPKNMKFWIRTFDIWFLHIFSSTKNLMTINDQLS